MSPAAQALLERLDAEGRAHVPVPRRLEPNELAAAMLTVARLALEVGQERDDLYFACQRGSRMNKPTAEWVFIWWTEAAGLSLEEALR